MKVRGVVGASVTFVLSELMASVTSPAGCARSATDNVPVAPSVTVNDVGETVTLKHGVTPMSTSVIMGNLARIAVSLGGVVKLSLCRFSSMRVAANGSKMSRSSAVK